MMATTNAAGGADRPEVLLRSVSRLRGRGLAIVSRLADAWGVDAADTGKAVWAEFR